MNTIFAIAFVWIALNAALLARLVWIDWVRPYRKGGVKDFSGEWR